MPEAARITDEITHTLALAGLIGGALLGVVIGAAIVFSGGAAVGVLAAAATMGTGASLGSMVGEFLGSFLTLPSGAIAIGSPNVLIGGLPAARATADFSMCGGIPFTPAPHPGSLIAQGSLTVFINNLPAARRGDGLVCGAKISSGRTDVLIGGEHSGTYLSKIGRASCRERVDS